MITHKNALFNKFSNQLSLLRKYKIIDFDLKFEKTYICPICLEPFSAQDLVVDEKKNYLTEEDAHPKSLGGKRVALTCKRCNSTSGHQIDFHLKEYFEDEAKSKFTKGTKQKATIEFEDAKLTVDLTSQGEGKLEAIHSIDRNNPILLNKFIESLKTNTPITINPKGSRVEGNRVRHAFLKTNYIITFSKFGYIFLLDPFYNEIREQIKNPSEYIMNYNLTEENTHFEHYLGTHYILDTDVKSILNIYPLWVYGTRRFFASFLPTPDKSFEKFIKAMINRTINGVAEFNMSEFDDRKDLFNDIDEIQKIVNWIGSEG